MKLMDCPNCGSQIRPRADGTCPSCGRRIVVPGQVTPNIAAIRNKWIEWLTIADDDDVLRFHQTVTDLLDEGGGDFAPPPVRS
jgi:hypothetical protein